jgi:hypothetical protein
MAEKRTSNARISLSKTQLQDGVGAELFSLCQGMSADGKLSKDEIVALGQWLNDNKDAPLPGINLLADTLKRIVADGRVTQDEQRELLEAVEKVLPADARKDAKAARKSVEKQRKAAAKEAREKQRQQEQEREFERQSRREPEDEFDFMVAGVHIEDRPSIIKRSVNVGERVRLKPEPDNPRDDCAVAVTLADGRMIGYVPRDDSEDVTGCLEDCSYYVARVKKILTGGRVPIPVVIAEFYRSDQAGDIADFLPDPCRSTATQYQSTYRPPADTNRPWWKIW